MFGVAERVLIVDDHPSFRRSARALLEAEGFTVVAEAEDAAGALDAVARLRPDVVLLDIQLPDLDGFAEWMPKIAVDEHAPPHAAPALNPAGL
jgi:DNA-binding NarL/FixJ family response regulator